MLRLKRRRLPRKRRLEDLTAASGSLVDKARGAPKEGPGQREESRGQLLQGIEHCLSPNARESVRDVKLNPGAGSYSPDMASSTLMRMELPSQMEGRMAEHQRHLTGALHQGVGEQKMEMRWVMPWPC